MEDRASSSAVVESSLRVCEMYCRVGVMHKGDRALERAAVCGVRFKSERVRRVRDELGEKTVAEEFDERTGGRVGEITRGCVGDVTSEVSTVYEAREIGGRRRGGGEKDAIGG